MSKNNENKLVPKFRFPEFQKDDKWSQNVIGDFVEKHKGGAPLTPSDFVSYSECEVIPKKAINEGVWLNLDIKSPTYCSESFYNANEQSIVDSTYLITTLRDLVPSGPSIGYIVKYAGAKKYILAQGVYGIKLKETLVPEFLIHFSNTDFYRKLVNAAMVGSTQVHIRNSDFFNLPIKVPKLKEQQKIAACLSSLDEVITAESQKLEVLKDHKKGLLQNLLPQAGETVPKFRFKEFEDSGEWVFDTFSEYIKLYRGSSPRPIQNYFTTDDTGVNWIKIGDTKNADNFIIKQVEERITPEGAEKSRKVNVGELILANSMSFGKTYQLAIEGYIYDGWFVLREYEQYFDKQFLLQLLNSDYMQKQYKKLSAGGIVQNISSDIVYKTILPHTSIDEQKQIAASLTSLDEFISAQSKKVEALQLHKKGLLQGLFPNVNEVTA
jgi:type I restriction enzyme S subunit